MCRRMWNEREGVNTHREDCKRKNKKKDIDDPYCFDDSKMHHMFARQYGDMRSIPEAVEELPEWDNADE